MNKRFTTLMTTLILSVFFSISASADVVEVDGIYYLILKSNLAIVTYGDKQYTGDITTEYIDNINNIIQNKIIFSKNMLMYDGYKYIKEK